MENKERIIDLNFNNFTLDREKLPESSGIYVICCGKIEGDMISELEILYIGESNNIKDRLLNKHEKYFNCAIHSAAMLKKMIYFYALVPNHYDRELAEKALIYNVNTLFNERIDCPEVSRATQIRILSQLEFPRVINIGE